LEAQIKEIHTRFERLKARMQKNLFKIC
jgi:hypothetical protein